MNGDQRTLTANFPGRFLLSLGVSHQVMVEGVRGRTYDRPCTRMRRFLDDMDAITEQLAGMLLTGDLRAVPDAHWRELAPALLAGTGKETAQR